MAIRGRTDEMYEDSNESGIFSYIGSVAGSQGGANV